MTQGNRRLDIEEANDVTIARFTDKKILDESNIQIIGNQLFNLVDEDHRQKMRERFERLLRKLKHPPVGQDGSGGAIGEELVEGAHCGTQPKHDPA